MVDKKRLNKASKTLSDIVKSFGQNKGEVKQRSEKVALSVDNIYLALQYYLESPYESGSSDDIALRKELNEKCSVSLFELAHFQKNVNELVKFCQSFIKKEVQDRT